MAYEKSANVKAVNANFNQDHRNVKVGQFTAIPKGNAQMAYGIDGNNKERFTVTRVGMLPLGEYEVRTTENQFSSFFGTFSDLVVIRIK